MCADILQNRVLITGLVAWLIGQGLKVPVEYLLNKKWNWGMLFSPGGMPSSHAALVTSVALAIGLQEGFGTPLFGLAIALAMVVVYDAAGVRRQAGMHAERINKIMKDLLEEWGVPEGELKEVLGHTTFEVIAGILLGCVLALAIYWLIPA